MIRIEIEAESAGELVRQLQILLNMQSARLQRVPASEFDQGAPLTQTVQKIVESPEYKEAIDDLFEQKEAQEIADKAITKAKPKKLKIEPVIVDDIEDTLPEEEPVHENLKDALALNKLKEETLGRLKDLFIAGKGKYIRTLLQKHGHGAMVFPEVEAKYFPAIKAEIDKEIGA